jgi:hydrogenase maturation factor HypF (carbamoyltransferase family)
LPASATYNTSLFPATACGRRNDLAQTGPPRFSSLEYCLSGGSFQNAILLRGLKQKLRKHGLQVYQHTLVPPGDGGLNLGQLLIAANSL